MSKKTENQKVNCLTETDQIKIQIDQEALKSLNSTRRVLQLCEESKDAAIRTLVMLDEQGEQLDRVDEFNDRINEDMKDAEKNLEGLEKCCGLFILPWKKTKTIDYKITLKVNDDEQVNVNAPRHSLEQNVLSNVSTNNFVHRITNDKYENEMDENIFQVSQMIGNLRNMAIDMGNEIKNQNQLIERVNNKTESNNQRTHDAKKRASKLLKM